MGNFSKHIYPGLSIQGILYDYDEMIRLSHLIVPTRVMEVNSILVPIDRNAPSTWPIPPIGQNCKYASGIFNGVRSVPQKDVELFYTGIKEGKTYNIHTIDTIAEMLGSTLSEKYCTELIIRTKGRVCNDPVLTHFVPELQKQLLDLLAQQTVLHRDECNGSGCPLGVSAFYLGCIQTSFTMYNLHDRNTKKDITIYEMEQTRATRVKQIMKATNSLYHALFGYPQFDPALLEKIGAEQMATDLLFQTIHRF